MSWWETAKQWGGAVVDSYSSASSGGSSNGMWSSILSGVGSYASDYLASKDKKDDRAATLEAERQRGLESRRTTAFTADLADHYDQLNKSRDKMALDSYAGLSLSKGALSSNPNVSVPNKPKPEDYHNG